MRELSPKNIVESDRQDESSRHIQELLNTEGPIFIRPRSYCFETELKKTLDLLKKKFEISGLGISYQRELRRILDDTIIDKMQHDLDLSNRTISEESHFIVHYEAAARFIVDQFPAAIESLPRDSSKELIYNLLCGAITPEHNVDFIVAIDRARQYRDTPSPRTKLRKPS